MDKLTLRELLRKLVLKQSNGEIRLKVNKK